MKQIHEKYLKAGADIIANMFRATSNVLTEYGLQKRTEKTD
ncbi:homocysteine S-methyltransferase family protein [[Anoxybacillus] calidus]